MPVVTRILKNVFLKIKAFLVTKNALVFFVFLLISTAAWFLNAIEKQQNTVFRLPIRFVGIPQNVLVTDSLPEFLTLHISDRGRQIFDYSNRERTPMTIDLTQTFYEKGEILLTSDQLRGQIMRYLQPSTTIEQIKPDSISINYEKLAIAKVWVQPNLHIELESQYMLSDEPQVEPQEITVFAPRRVLDTLKTVYTQQIMLSNLRDSVVVAAQLKKLHQVRFSTDNVSIRLNVEMFTEKKLQIPITVSNCPARVAIKTFPAVVDVSFNVGVSYYNTVDINDIVVDFDYYSIATASNSKVPLTVRSLVPHISNLKMNPAEVEFVIEERY